MQVDTFFLDFFSCSELNLPEPGQNETVQDFNLGLEYNKYLQEVVQILENDPEFRKKLESAKVDEIRDGTIAKELGETWEEKK